MSTKYFNPYTDFGFKKLFGEEANKDLLIDFLNAVLPHEHAIETLDFRNSELLGRSAQDRKAVYDIFCQAKNGERFIVEMQKAKQLYFKDRALFYAARPIVEQAVQGEWDYKLAAVYLVAIVDFLYDESKELEKFSRDVMLMDQYGKPFSYKLRMKFLQMPTFTKTESELETQEEKWYYFLKNLESFDDIPAILREPVFEKAFQTAELAAMSKKDRERYDSDLDVYRDNYAAFKTAEIEGYDKGKAEGIEEGMEKGRKEEKIGIARNLKQMGLDPVAIAKATNLTLREIGKIDD